MTMAQRKNERNWSWRVSLSLTAVLAIRTACAFGHQSRHIREHRVAATADPSPSSSPPSSTPFRRDPKKVPQESEGNASTLSSSTNTDPNAKIESPPTSYRERPAVPITPCNRICRYNPSFYDGQVCIGCFRETYEIATWQSMTPHQKSLTLLDALERCPEASDAGGDVFVGAVASEDLARQQAHWSELAQR